jgi:hypothetical protein
MEQPRARIAGVFYLLTFLTGGLAVPASTLVVSGDAAATAANIVAHQPLFLLGFAAYVMNVACYVVVTQLFYDLFRRVNESASLLAAFFSLVGCAIQATACLFQLGALAVVGGPQQSLALLLLRLHAQGYNVGLVFFGFYCLLIGYLIFKSNFLPRTLGVLMACAGLGWLTFLSPPLIHAFDPYIRIPGVLGEGSLMLWLLVNGVAISIPRLAAPGRGIR